MPPPLVVTISHHLGREGAKRRIEEGIGSIRSQVAAVAVSIEDRWEGDRLELRAVALGQQVAATAEVFDDVVRVEVQLPGVLGMIANAITRRIRVEGTKLLEKQ